MSFRYLQNWNYLYLIHTYSELILVKYKKKYHTPCDTSFNAADRNRTGTGDKARRILSPVRLPVPPLRHSKFPWEMGPTGLEPVTLCL